MKFGMRSRSLRSRSWMSCRSARTRSANESSRTVVSCPPENRLAASRATSLHLGCRAVREGGRGHRRHDVVAGLAPPVLDVGRELLVEELERLVLQLLVQLGQALGEQAVVGLGDAFEVGDHQQRERRRVGADELAAAGATSSSSWRSASRSMNSSFARSRPGVSRRIISARCAVCRGGSNDGSWSLNGSRSRWRSMMSVTSSPSKGSGNLHERPAHHVARREGGRVVVDRQRLLVARSPCRRRSAVPATPATGSAPRRSTRTDRPARIGRGRSSSSRDRPRRAPLSRRCADLV